MSQSQVPTPLTNALLLELNEGRVFIHDGPLANFARNLERRLAAAEQRVKGLEAALRELVDAYDEKIGLRLGITPPNIAGANGLRMYVAWENARAALAPRAEMEGKNADG